MRRVLFRLWIIATVLWGLTVALMGVVIWQDADYGNHIYEVAGIFDAREGIGGGSSEGMLAKPGNVIFVKGYGEFRIDGDKPTPEERAAILSETERRDNLVAEYASNERVKLLGILSGTFLLPPLLLLALGASLVWAFRGYRRTKPE